MANKNTSGTEPQIAPVSEPTPEVKPVEAAPAPVRRKTVERQGSVSAPQVVRMPEVRGGICEFCGVIDKNIPSEYQYKLCPHFQGQGDLRCSYCDESKDPTEIIGHSVLNIYEHPNNRDQWVVVCNSYDCTRKHRARFLTAGA